MSASLRRIAGILGALAPALTAALVSLANASRGNPIGSFAVEYASGGSCKLREDDAFELLLLAALLAYPIGGVAAAVAGARREWPLVAIAGAGILLLALTGHAGPALGICPSR